MGKKVNTKQETIKDPQSFPIHKNKTFEKNLNEFLKMMCARFSNISVKEYLKLVHKHIARCRKTFKWGKNQRQIVQTLQKIRICKACDSWAKIKEKIIKCSVCDDYYHLKCLKDSDFE